MVGNRFNEVGKSSGEVEIKKNKDHIKAVFLETAKQADNIQHMTRESAKTSKIKDFMKQKSTPEHINTQIDQFQATVEKLRNKITDFKYLPMDLGQKFVEVFKELTKGFEEASGDVAKRYEKSLEDANAILTHMMADLGRWRQLREARTKIKAVLDKNAQGEIREDFGAAKKIYGKILNGYQEKQRNPAERREFLNIIDKLIDKLFDIENKKQDRGQDQANLTPAEMSLNKAQEQLHEALKVLNPQNWDSVAWEMNQTNARSHGTEAWRQASERKEEGREWYLAAAYSALTEKIWGRVLSGGSSLELSGLCEEWVELQTELRKRLDQIKEDHSNRLKDVENEKQKSKKLLAMKNERIRSGSQYSSDRDKSGRQYEKIMDLFKKMCNEKGREFVNNIDLDKYISIVHEHYTEQPPKDTDNRAERSFQYEDAFPEDYLEEKYSRQKVQEWNVIMHMHNLKFKNREQAQINNESIDMMRIEHEKRYDHQVLLEEHNKDWKSIEDALAETEDKMEIELDKEKIEENSKGRYKLLKKIELLNKTGEHFIKDTINKEYINLTNLLKTTYDHGKNPEESKRVFERYQGNLKIMLEKHLTKVKEMHKQQEEELVEESDESLKELLEFHKLEEERLQVKNELERNTLVDSFEMYFLPENEKREEELLASQKQLGLEYERLEQRLQSEYPQQYATRKVQ